MEIGKMSFDELKNTCSQIMTALNPSERQILTDLIIHTENDQASYISSLKMYLDYCLKKLNL